MRKCKCKTLTVKVDLAGESGDADQGGRPDAQQRRHGFIEELRIHIGRLLEDDDIPTGALGGSGLYVCVYVSQRQCTVQPSTRRRLVPYHTFNTRFMKPNTSRPRATRTRPRPSVRPRAMDL